MKHHCKITVVSSLRSDSKIVFNFWYGFLKFWVKFKSICVCSRIFLFISILTVKKKLIRLYNMLVDYILFWHSSFENKIKIKMSKNRPCAHIYENFGILIGLNSIVWFRLRMHLCYVELQLLYTSILCCLTYSSWLLLIFTSQMSHNF